MRLSTQFTNLPCHFIRQQIQLKRRIIMRKKIWYLCMSMFIVVMPLSAQTIDIRGHVQTETGDPIYGAAITVSSLNTTIGTDVNGKFYLSDGPLAINFASHQIPLIPEVRGTNLIFFVQNQSSKVSISIFDGNGNVLNDPITKNLVKGSYKIAPFIFLPTNAPRGMYYIQLVIGATASNHKMLLFDLGGDRNGLRKISAGVSSLATTNLKTTNGTPYSLHVSKNGFKSVTIPLYNLNVSLPPIVLTPADREVIQDMQHKAWDKQSKIAHEWGTFVSVQGSDGLVLDGLVHEEQDLPDFVYDLRDSTGVTGYSPKMETPVIYFYSPYSMKLAVRVDFPQGIVTQWYPAASWVNHAEPYSPFSEPSTNQIITDLTNGYIEWGGGNILTILAPQDTTPLAKVEENDPWIYSRQVDANTIKVCNVSKARIDNNLSFRLKEEYKDYEKCLFYRGLGNFPLPLIGQVTQEIVTAENCIVSMSLTNSKPTEQLKHLFIIKVVDNKAGFYYLPSLTDQHHLVKLMIQLEPMEISTEKLVLYLAEKLTLTGLYYKEALAMARTWQQGYFQDNGLRVLYVLPRSFVDNNLPLTFLKFGVENNPFSEVVRTFVARTELISPEREAQMLNTVRALAFGTTEERNEAVKVLNSWGRFAIPYLEKVKSLTDDSDILALVGELIDQHNIVN